MRKTALQHKGVFHFYYSKIKRGAKRRSIPFNITLEIIGDLWEKHPICPYSNISLKQCIGRNDVCYTASLDRKDPSKGYQPNNIQWIWKPLNKMKGSLTDKQFKEILRVIKNNK